MIQIDMEMPKNCVDCVLNRHMHCTITYDLIPLEKRLDNCPMHEVNTDSDIISREAAIDALDKRFDSIPMEQTTEILLLRKDLRNLPSAQPEVLACGEGELSAQPEREKGKWIDRGWSGDGRGNSWHEWECSECKHITKGAKWNFCPNCGARMEDGE